MIKHDFVDRLFPFFLLLNKNLIVLDFGSSLKKVMILEKGESFFECFSIKRPMNVKNLEAMMSKTSTLFILESKSSERVKLRGQMYWDETQQQMYFLGGPIINSFQDMEAMNLSLKDLALHDNTNQFLFTLQVQSSSIKETQTMVDKLAVYKDDLEKALKEAEIAKQAQHRFFAKMSHELRTPLNSIIGMSGLLHKTRLDAKQEKYLSAVSISSKNLLNIINDILDLTKIKTDNFSLEKTRFSVRQVVEDVYESMKFKAVEKGIDFSYSIAENILYNVGDPQKISQVLLNFVNNALKFTDEGKVKLEVNLIMEAEEFQEMEFVVTDTGKGIAKDKLQTIFNAFEQEDDGITRQYGGTGLGLSIAKEIIEQYGSAINVQSALGVGTTFSFVLRLPVAIINTIEEKEKKAMPKYNWENIKILLVEDNEINQFYAETILTQEKILVTVANNGIEAIEKVTKEKFDLILMDMQMPVMNGLEATKHIRTNLDADIPIVGLSANVIEHYIESCYEAGMNSYITKPFDAQSLFQAIGAMLDLDEVNISENNIPTAVNVKDEYTLDNIKKISFGKNEVIVKFLTMFVNRVPTELKFMLEAFDVPDFEKVKSIAHKVISNFSIVGAERAITICRFIEQYDFDGKTKEDLSEIQEGMDKLMLIVDALDEEFKEIISSLT